MSDTPRPDPAPTRRGSLRSRAAIRPPGPTGASRIAAGLAVAALVAAPLPAPGQEAPAADTVPRFELDSLVVSVLRTPVRLGESAYPVSVVGSESLRRGKTGLSLDEALSGLPGVEVQNRYNFAIGERVYIRGFGPRAQFGVRGVKVVVDGIPATLPDGQTTLDHVDVGSLGRVEALRGPASSLYGNAAGGVLRFETRPPPPAPFRQEVEWVSGGDGLLRLQSTTGGSAGGTGYLLNLSRLEYDGFRGRPEAAGLYGGADRLLLNGQASRAFGDSRLEVTVNAMDLDAQNPGSLPADLLATRQAWGFNIVQRTAEDIQQGQAGVRWTAPVGGAEVELMGYGIARSVTSRIPPDVIELDRSAGGLRALARSAPGAGRGGLRWTAGAEVDLQRDDRVEWENDAGDRGAALLDQLETVRGLAAFAQGHLPLGPSLRLQGGLRYDHFRFEADDRLVSAGDDSGERAMDAWSPSLGLEVDLGARADLFASVSTSFETPTTSELSNRADGARGFNPELDPQRSVGIEAGVRGTAARRLSYELVAYRTAVDDELVPFEVASAPGRTYFRNAGSSAHRGVEAFLQARLAPGLEGRLSYAYADARFDEYTVDGTDLSDKRIPGLPPHRVTGSLRAASGPWYAEVEAEYLDEIPVNDENTASTDSYVLLDLRAGADGLRVAGFEISPFAGVRNLTDELYSASVIVNAFGGRYFEPGPDRSFYVGLRTGWSAR